MDMGLGLAKNPLLTGCILSVKEQGCHLRVRVRKKILHEVGESKD